MASAQSRIRKADPQLATGEICGEESKMAGTYYHLSGILLFNLADKGYLFALVSGHYDGHLPAVYQSFTDSASV